jgi:hypothetical protein
MNGRANFTDVLMIGISCQVSAAIQLGETPMYMNQEEIEWAAKQEHACPNVRKGTQVLLKLMEAVNAQSDGWHSWPAPSRSAEKLQELLKTAGNLHHRTQGTISAADLKKAIAPIRSMVTIQKKKQAQYGNKFDFDVDAALQEKLKSGLTKEQVQKVIDQVDELIDLENDYENKQRQPNERPDMRCGTNLRTAKERLTECLEDCQS